MTASQSTLALSVRRLRFLGQIDYPNLGAQDCFWQNKGAYTGQVSPAQLKDLGVKYAIVGHSERREVGETDDQASLKVKALLDHKIIPVLCVGFGTTVDQDDLEVVDILATQLDIGLRETDPQRLLLLTNRFGQFLRATHTRLKRLPHRTTRKNRDFYPE